MGGAHGGTRGIRARGHPLSVAKAVGLECVLQHARNAAALLGEITPLMNDEKDFLWHFLAVMSDFLLSHCWHPWK